MDVETLAVNEISSLIAMCPRLIPLITTNDKTPFTDGNIDIYSGLKRNKEEWVGRVSVQIKGRTTPASGKFPKAYPISRTDLQAFQSDSGVLYFVVSIDRDTRIRRPLYALLSPFYIEKILRDAAPRTRRISVPLKDFPTNPDEIERIVRVAYKTREQQPSAGDASSLIPQMQSISVYSAKDLDFNAPLSLVPGASDYALVLTTAEGLSLPLNGELQIFPPDYISRSVDLKVECGDVIFEQATMQRIDAETIEMKLSEGLTLRFRMQDGTQSAEAAFALVDLLPERMKVLRFYVALLDRHPIVIDGKSSQCEIVEGDDPERRRHLDYLYQLAELFEILDVDIHLVNLGEIDKAQHRELQFLHRSLVEHEEFLDVKGQKGRVLQKVGRWLLMLLVVPGSEPGSWRHVDPFAPESRHEFRAGQKRMKENASEYVPATIYEVVEEEHLSSTLNLRLDRITEAYDVIADLPDTTTLANFEVLSLISAADASEERREAFLDAANALNEWLIVVAGDEPYHLVNRWQILWRRRHLSSTHRSEIRGLKREMSRSDIELAGQIEFACALLLDEHEEAEYCLEQLTTEKRDQLENWPLWALRKPTVELAVTSAV